MFRRAICFVAGHRWKAEEPSPQSVSKSVFYLPDWPYTKPEHCRRCGAQRWTTSSMVELHKVYIECFGQANYNIAMRQIENTK